MAVKRNVLVFFVFLILISGLTLAGTTIIQKGNIITDVFNATSLFVERISGYQLKGDIDAFNKLVKNLADPREGHPQDAATKKYVDEKCGFKGLACDGVSDPSHGGENPDNSCETKEIFLDPTKSQGEEVCWEDEACYDRGPRFGGRTCENVTLCSPPFSNKPLVGDAAARKFCKEEGYSDYSYYLTDWKCADCLIRCSAVVLHKGNWACANTLSALGGYPPGCTDALYVQCHYSTREKTYYITELGCG